jgi:hypothetical protein
MKEARLCEAFLKWTDSWLLAVGAPVSSVSLHRAAVPRLRTLPGSPAVFNAGVCYGLNVGASPSSCVET